MVFMKWFFIILRADYDFCKDFLIYLSWLWDQGLASVDDQLVTIKLPVVTLQLSKKTSRSFFIFSKWKLSW